MADEVKTTKLDGAALIAAERRRQIEVEGWSPEHDDKHDGGQLSHAAACYALGRTELRLNAVTTHFWPWDRHWWKPKDRISDLVRAGALIAAEIDRLKRAEPRP